MDVHRAKEILQSVDYIDVTYRGTPVHIDQVYESSPFAEVRYDNGAVTSVAVEELQEQ